MLGGTVFVALPESAVLRREALPRARAVPRATGCAGWPHPLCCGRWRQGVLLGKSVRDMDKHRCLVGGAFRRSPTARARHHGCCACCDFEGCRVCMRGPQDRSSCLLGDPSLWSAAVTPTKDHAGSQGRRARLLFLPRELRRSPQGRVFMLARVFAWREQRSTGVASRATVAEASVPPFRKTERLRPKPRRR